MMFQSQDFAGALEMFTVSLTLKGSGESQTFEHSSNPGDHLDPVL
jgi:hypothetical protein